MTKNTVRHVLLELERAGWDSLCNQTGSEYYGELMLPNALLVLAHGIAMDPGMGVSALSQYSTLRTYDIGDVRLIEVDNGNAVLVSTGTAYREADEPAFVGGMSSACQLSDILGRWRCEYCGGRGRSIPGVVHRFPQRSPDAQAVGAHH